MGRYTHSRCIGNNDLDIDYTDKRSIYAFTTKRLAQRQLNGRMYTLTWQASIALMILRLFHRLELPLEQSLPHSLLLRDSVLG
jgi:hypothetical protein